jgi:hypothetical protein
MNNDTSVRTGFEHKKLQIKKNVIFTRTSN